MLKLFLILLTSLTFAQSPFWKMELMKSPIEEIADVIGADYYILKDANGNIVKDSNDKVVCVHRVSQYAYNFNNEFQFYVRRKNEILIGDNRLLAFIQRKRTNLL